MVVVLASLFVGLAVVWAAETAAKVAFENDQQKVSYAIGFQAGSSYRSQEVPIHLDMLIQGLKDGFGGQTSVLSSDETQQVMTAFRKDMQARADKKRKDLADKNLAEGKAFLEANAKKEGVQVLASGLQYKVLKEGTGKTPVATDRVKVHYRGTLINGTEFDSSTKGGKPVEFLVTQVIKGWIEALQLMKEGSKWELYVPAALAYGEPGRPSIPPNSVLVFEVELLEILKPDPNAPPASAAKPTPTTVKPTPTPGAKPQ
ncbi:MAG: FKBP-type peptidyl-prolyl cis-trans isomerase [Phycisphaerae bacterium]|nr:FKBP-type peptidyl-prolyl cis-trans isomerase [Phycisphaerae bacterium]